ncbi:unnamed protein product [Diamesa serratosioi]
MEDNVNKCRICLRVKKSRKLVSLFDENSKNIMKIFLLTGVKADDYIDLLPNKICLKCSDSLLDAFQIRNLCIESDRLLRKQLHDLNLLADKEPKIEVTDNQHENEDFISIAQTNHQNNNQVFTKTEDDFESFPDFEPSEFLSEDFEESIETKVKKRSKAKVKESKKVILTKKYKLTDPKMFTEIKSEKPTRQPCPICGRMLTSNYLSHHIKTHSDKPEFWCDHCPLTFKIKGYLVAHLTNIHFTNIKIMEEENPEQNNSDYEEEEFLVYVDIDSAVSKNLIEDPNCEIKVIGLESDKPVLQINNKIFEGEYENSLGTHVFFEHDKETKSDPIYSHCETYYKFCEKTNKVLKMARVSIKELNTDNTLEGPPDEDNLAQLRVSRTYEQALNLFLEPGRDAPRRANEEDDASKLIKSIKKVKLNK